MIFIKFGITKISVECNEDGKLAVYSYVSILDMATQRVMIFPNEEYPEGTVTPWNVHQAANHLRKRYGCE